MEFAANRPTHGLMTPDLTRPGVFLLPASKRWEAVLTRLMPLVWISIGAVPGAIARYLVNQLMARWLGTGFPYGTLVVNTAGCLAIGVVGTLVTGRLIDRPDVVRLVMIVGFLGSLTTFSSFAWETNNLLHDAAWARALLNIALSVVAGLAGVRLGVLMTPKLGGLL
jgi:fluoride exporter